VGAASSRDYNGLKSGQFNHRINFGFIGVGKKANIEGMYSNYFIKELSAARPPFDILQFAVQSRSSKRSV